MHARLVALVHTHTRVSMGIHGAIPYLRRVHGDLVLNEASGAPYEADLLVVDFMNTLFTLTMRYGGGNDDADAGDAGDGTGDAVATGGTAAAPAAPRPRPRVPLTGASAFEIVSRTVLKWFSTPLVPATDPATGAPRKRRAILITDKPAWVPLAKRREQAERAAAMAKQAARATAEGTYQRFDADGAAVRFDDGGIVAPRSTGSPLSVPFDGFSVISQRPARNALVVYLRARFAHLDLPPHAELVIDFDDNTAAPLLVNARPHATPDGGDAPCAMSPVLNGHAQCGGDDGGLWRPSKRTGEAELLAIQYALQSARAGAPGRTICIRSADADVIGAACRAFWDAPNGVRLLWWQRADVVVDLTALYARLHTWQPARGGAPVELTPEHVILALIAQGTDYARKRDLFNQIGEDTLWDAICTFPLPAAPGEDGAAMSPSPQPQPQPPPPSPPKRARVAAADATDAAAAAAGDMNDDYVDEHSGPFGGDYAAEGYDYDDDGDAGDAKEADDAAGGNDLACRHERAATATSQRMRRWGDVEHLVMHVYMRVAHDLKPTGAATNAAAQRILALFTDSGAGAHVRRPTRKVIEALYRCFGQRRIAPPPLQPQPQPVAADASRTQQPQSGDKVAGRRVRAAAPLADFRESCVHVLENLSYWYANPMNEQRVDSAFT